MLICKSLNNYIYRTSLIAVEHSNKLLLTLFLLPLLSSAQNNYQPGFIVNSKGDTLHGFINYTEWGNNPQKISFKPEPSGCPLKFTVNDIKYFSVFVGRLAEYEKYEGPILQI